MDHLAKLEELTSAISDLDMVQSWIDNARIAAPANQVVQRNLDRQQIEVDYKRDLINAAMIYLSSQN